MKRLIRVIMMMVLAVSVGTITAFAADGFYTSGTKLLDAKGNEFVMRGANFSYAWQHWGNEANTLIPAAKRIGCNTLRIQISTGKRWNKTTRSELQKLISLCEQNKIIAVFNTHDETGSNNFSDLESAANYWIEMKDLLNQHRNTVIINVSNEWYGDWSGEPWANGYKQVIPRLRQAGILNTLMIDAAGWGQYPESIWYYGDQVLASDPQRNIVFSIHMYQDCANTDQKVKNAIDYSLQVGAPVVIGEFAYRHQGKDIAWQTILDYTAQKKVGYIVWSWTGNGGGTEECDMFGSYDDSQYRQNGTNTVKGRNGISSTSVECTVFNNTNPGGNQGGNDPDPGTNPGGSTTSGTEVLWQGQLDLGAWKGMFEYKNDPANCPDWKNDKMQALNTGDKIRVTFSNVSNDASKPGQIQFNLIDCDATWSWVQVCEADPIVGNTYEYTIKGQNFGSSTATDLEMLRQRGFTIKGQQATIVKVEAIYGNGGNQGGNQGGNDPNPGTDPGDNGDVNGQTIFLWEGSVEYGNWKGMYEYKADPSNCPYWDAAKMAKVKAGAKIVLHFTNVSNDASRPGQCQFNLIDTDGAWSWIQIDEAANISGNKYTYTVTGNHIGGSNGTDVEMLRQRGFTSKGQQATLVKAELVIPASGNSIDEIEMPTARPAIDFDLPYEIYTLDGRRVAQAIPGTICILRQGSTVIKHLAR